MARRRSATLTEAELRLMEVLWERGHGNRRRGDGRPAAPADRLQ